MESNEASIGCEDGVTEGKEATVAYVRELRVRYRGNKGPTFDPIGAPADAAKLLRQVMPDNVREHFVVLFLNGRHYVVAYFVVSTGTATSCLVGAREVFQAALVAGATALVVGHNHPSGGTEPSQADRAITKRLKEAGELLGIPVLDHLVIGGDEYYSFKDREGI